MKDDRYTTFGLLPMHTVFQYAPDEVGLGARVKVAEDLCCTLDFYLAHDRNPPEDTLTEASWERNSGVFPVENSTRVWAIPSDKINRVTCTSPEEKCCCDSYTSDIAALIEEVERLRADLDALSRAVGQALVAATLAEGETLSDPIPHVIVSTVTRLRAEVSYLRTRVPPVHPGDYGHEAWIESGRAAVDAERAAVVAWLRHRSVAGDPATEEE